MTRAAIQLEPSWLAVLQEEFQQPYMCNLKKFLGQEKAAGKTVYPPGNQIFNAFNSTPLHSIKVVILGQDPYHGPGQAHGLAFSVQQGVRPPPSLLNIFKEIRQDLDLPLPSHGNLQHWANQGVLLLNATLTVEQGRAGSHQGRGWEAFTDKAIATVSDACDAVVFLLWGSYAQKKGALVDRSKHLVLASPHPSPLSASRGFLGNRHFSKSNHWLQEHGKKPVDWSIP